ncbi:hypothetical protein B4U79_07271 [Dinothrombium tinctorium]|uniref:Uncharacterized protein n=1 Tax=Dinothrombium tinctorium TaxID=1965070 RepID=A0A443RGS7_9ACAR|nr:hypothetical protein B4U79_07271 [Dinothrombium tinctorium]
MFCLKLRKAKSTLQNTHSAFEAQDDESEKEEEVVVKRQKLDCELTGEQKGKKLKEEGIILAENNRFWQAIDKWNQALTLLPNDETIYEMKAQSLMELNEIFPAVEAALKSVQLKCNWFVAYQTYGRALLNVGEIEKAVKSFCRAIHLNPEDGEVRQDLEHSLTLLSMRKQREREHQ